VASGSVASAVADVQAMKVHHATLPSACASASKASATGHTGSSSPPHSRGAQQR
jgi:hypothetical protein